MSHTHTQALSTGIRSNNETNLSQIHMHYQLVYAAIMKLISRNYAKNVRAIFIPEYSYIQSGSVKSIREKILSREVFFQAWVVIH